MRIGIDIGNVIIGGGGDDTMFTDQYLQTPEVEDARESVQALVDQGHEIHIVSKCGKTTQQKSQEWLEWHMYWRIVSPYNTHFVRNRELKAPMAQALRLDVFIDDRQDVLDPMEGTVKHPILFTSWEQTNKELAKILDRPA